MPFELFTLEIHSGDARRTALLTHGLLGSGRNLRSLARAIVERDPQRGVLLVDLREHGRSMGASPPHTIHAAAEDLALLAREQTSRGVNIDALIGHSLGGKAVLLARDSLPFAQTWVLDSSLPVVPAPYHGSDTMRVVEMLESLPDATYPQRSAFVQEIERRGFGTPLAHWLATNLEEDSSSGSYHFARDMASIRCLIESYFALDGFELLTSTTKEQIHLVFGTRSTNHSDGDRERVDALARDRPGLFVHDIDAGHWLHSERKDELADLLVRHLPGS